MELHCYWCFYIIDRQERSRSPMARSRGRAEPSAVKTEATTD